MPQVGCGRVVTLYVALVHDLFTKLQQFSQVQTVWFDSKTERQQTDLLVDLLQQAYSFTGVWHADEVFDSVRVDVY